VLEPTLVVDEDQTALLFVYGTLIDPAQLQRVLGHLCPGVPAILKAYRRHQGRYPYIVQAAGHTVTGSIICDLREDDFTKLDECEAVRPVFCEGAMRRLYGRELTSTLTREGISVRCWVYVPNLRDWPADWR
jgi:gamma-glutamylcyclotransferase (GGCT)/AIG2-like uncharacterized protein YtfP